MSRGPGSGPRSRSRVRSSHPVRSAEVGSHTGFHGSEALAVRVPARHVEIAPHLGEVFLLDAEQTDALPAGHLHQRDGVLVGHVGDAAQSDPGSSRRPSPVGRRRTCRRVGCSRTRSLMNSAPGSSTQSGPHTTRSSDASASGGRVLTVGGQGGEYVGHRAQAPVPHYRNQFGLRERHAPHIPVGFRREPATGAGDDVTDHRLARSAALTGSCLCDHVAQRRRTRMHTRDDRALAHVVADTHLRVVGQVGDTRWGVSFRYRTAD